MLLGDHGAADAKALEARALDQARGVIAGRIGEHRAAARARRSAASACGAAPARARRPRAPSSRRARTRGPRPGTTRRSPGACTLPVADVILARARACVQRAARVDRLDARTTCAQVSPPKAPAFIASAPPTCRGCRRRTPRDRGPSARTGASRARTARPPRSARALARERSSSRGNAPWVQMTTPRMPPSRTSRLLPRPSQSSGTPRAATRGTRPARRDRAACRTVRRAADAPRRVPAHRLVAQRIARASTRPIDHDAHSAPRRRARGERSRQGRARPRRCCRRRASATTSPSRSTSREHGRQLVDSLDEDRLDCAAPRTARQMRGRRRPRSAPRRPRRPR